jgi:hypothetical protein
MNQRRGKNPEENMSDNKNVMQAEAGNFWSLCSNQQPGRVIRREIGEGYRRNFSIRGSDSSGARV